MDLLRNASALLGLAVLAGCGGSNSVSNPAHLRFFNALKSTNSNSSLNTTNVRLIVGGHLFSASKEGPSYEYGDGLGSYGDAPTGTSETVTLSPYSAIGTTTASLTAQTLVVGRHYTLIAVTGSVTTSGVVTTDTQTLKLFSDFLTQAANTEYFRLIDASPSTVYLKLVNAAGTTVFGSATSISTTTGLTAGGSTGYQALAPTGTNTSDNYSLQVYSDSALSNEIASGTVTLTVGSPKTIVLYDSSSTSTSGLKIKTVTDSPDSN